jgi:hypothetical protein
MMTTTDTTTTIKDDGIAAISGHASLREVERYTKAADQARLARAAMERQASARKGVA